MARTNIDVQTMTRSGGGLTPVYEAVDEVNGMSFLNTGREFVHLKNINAATRNVTALTPGSVDNLAIEDYVATIPADEGDKMLPPFPPSVYNQNDGRVYLDFSAGADLTIAVIRVP